MHGCLCCVCAGDCDAAGASAGHVSMLICLSCWLNWCMNELNWCVLCWCRIAWRLVVDSKAFHGVDRNSCFHCASWLVSGVCRGFA